MTPGTEGMPEAPVHSGRVADALTDEFTGLALRYSVLEGTARRSPPEVKERLSDLSDRVGGAQAIHLRQRPIPSAYRVFFRQIGLDPDVDRTPIEALILERMRAGGFQSRNLIDDAITIAIAETEVAMCALDADRVEGEPLIRPSLPDEPFEGRVAPIPDGTLVIADSKRPLAYLYGPAAEGRGPGRDTRRVMVIALGVEGVAEVVLDEAIWVAATVLGV